MDVFEVRHCVITFELIRGSVSLGGFVAEGYCDQAGLASLSEWASSKERINYMRGETVCFRPGRDCPSRFVKTGLIASVQASATRHPVSSTHEIH